MLESAGLRFPSSESLQEAILSEEQVVEDAMVVQLEYKLTVDGETIDSTDFENGGPIEFIQGRGHIIPGLESELYGMRIGEARQVAVEPAQAYGDIDPDAYVTLKREDFPQSMAPEMGMIFEMSEPDGDPLLARVIGIEGDEIEVDMNHPLAGKDLLFDVKVVGLRPASQEELDHGHVHSHGEH
jgi:FKBP-type peptidyl-prolyl cis-trans isomerase SlyD